MTNHPSIYSNLNGGAKGIVVEFGNGKVAAMHTCRLQLSTGEPTGKLLKLVECPARYFEMEKEDRPDIFRGAGVSLLFVNKEPIQVLIKHLQKLYDDFDVRAYEVHGKGIVIADGEDVVLSGVVRWAGTRVFIVDAGVELEIVPSSLELIFEEDVDDKRD